MDERGRQEPGAVEATSKQGEGSVRTHETRPGRLVFTEDGNTDGWIATDLVLEPRR